MDIRTFLMGLGLSSYEIGKLFRSYGENDTVLRLLESPAGRKELSEVIDSSSVDAAHMQLCRIWAGKQVFLHLEPLGVPAEIAYKFFLSCSEDEGTALTKLMTDPYSLIFDFGAPFPAVNAVASLAGYTNDEVRTEAAVYAALLLAEGGTEEQRFDELGDKISSIAGSTCLPFGELISIAQELLGGDDALAVDAAAKRLHYRKRILLTRKTVDGKPRIFAYRAEMAALEFGAAEIIRERLDMGKLHYGSNPYAAIDSAQAALELYLSFEQVDAVHSALTNRISVITGGPGTGKTATQKVLLEAYRMLSKGRKVMLMAPTGQAAKRMETATGYPASTIHSALGIFPGETDSRKATDLKAGLIIVDEFSMVDAQLLYMLLDHVSPDTILVVVGDVDQLPSIGAGNVLTELKKCVPVSRLTKIFRQSGDAADIAYNAARINAGATQMIESERFTFIDADDSASIQTAVCDFYKQAAETVGLENVMVLSPLRRKTRTGVNQLNRAIRKTCSDASRFITCGDLRIYEKDKVVFLKNRFGLSNGSVGFVTKISKDKAECLFGDKKLTLSGSQLSWIVPAYAETIHKSQGDEYKVVILVSDSCHTASKQMIYTAVTRAKDRIYIVGQRSAFEQACRRDGTCRYSILSTLVKEGH